MKPKYIVYHPDIVWQDMSGQHSTCWGLPGRGVLTHEKPYNGKIAVYYDSDPTWRTWVLNAFPGAVIRKVI